MPYYAFTIKKTRGVPTDVHYENYLEWLSHKFAIWNVNYEYHKGMHVHCILEAAKTPALSEVKFEKYGWSFRIVPIYNLTGWKKYITKDAIKNMQDEVYGCDPRVRSTDVGEFPVDNPNIFQEDYLDYKKFDIRKLCS